MEEEIWKDIIGYEGLYQVSNMGNIKSLNYRRTGKEKILSGGKDSRGYISVGLFKNKKGKTHTIHRLVILNFIKNINKKREVNHIDGNKSNNKLINLEYVTSSENRIHSYNVLGNKCHFQIKHIYKGKFGKEHFASKKVNQFNLDGIFIKSWDSIVDIERTLGIQQRNISAVCNGKRKTAGKFIFKFLI